MISFSEFYLLESTEKITGMITQASTAAVPIPGASIILAPVASKIGEKIGSILPDSKKVPKVMKDSLDIYSSAKKENTSMKLSDQIEKRKKYKKKAKQLGYNSAGQILATVDPTLVSVVPKIIIKKWR